MIQQEMITRQYDGQQLIRTWSDRGMMIRQETGIEYEEAIDIPGMHTYTETETPIQPDVFL